MHWRAEFWLLEIVGVLKLAPVAVQNGVLQLNCRHTVAEAIVLPHLESYGGKLLD